MAPASWTKRAEREEGAVVGSDRKATDLERRTRWLARLEAYTERPLTVLALLLIPLILVPYLFALPGETEQTLISLDYFIWAVFAADLAAKLAVAPDRRRYLITHWMDVLLVALPLLRPLRATRSIQGVRSLRVGMAGVAAIRALVGMRRIRVRRGVRYVVLSALVVIVVAGCMITVLERNHPEANIHTLPDGIWWAVTTVTTVGYGDTFPRTPVGRGVGVALMLTGIGLFGVLTASLSAFFLEESEDELGAQLREVNERLKQLEARLDARSTASTPVDEEVGSPS